MFLKNLFIYLFFWNVTSVATIHPFRFCPFSQEILSVGLALLSPCMSTKLMSRQDPDACLRYTWENLEHGTFSSDKWISQSIRAHLDNTSLSLLQAIRTVIYSYSLWSFTFVWLILRITDNPYMCNKLQQWLRPSADHRHWWNLILSWWRGKATLAFRSSSYTLTAEAWVSQRIYLFIYF